MVIVDFDSVGEGFMVIPEGTYLIRVRKFERKQSKSGNDMIQWHGVVVEGPHMGATLADFNVLTDAASWKVARFIKAAGVDIGGKVDTGSSKFVAALNACVGNTMYWQVSMGPNDKGNPSNKVETYAADTNQQRVSVVDEDAPAWAKE